MLSMCLKKYFLLISRFRVRPIGASSFFLIWQLLLAITKTYFKRTTGLFETLVRHFVFMK